MKNSKFLSMISLLLGLSSTQAGTSTERILCFGDSITDKGEWVATVGKLNSFETINAGKSGRKAAQAVEALTMYLEKYSNLDRIILFLGVNDLPARDPRPGDEKVDVCVSNMSAAIDLALTRFAPDRIILVAPCDVNSDTMNDINRQKGYHITPPLLAKMEIQYKALAEEKGVQFLSLLKVVSKENYQDGLHPNKEGDAEIAKAVTDFLTSLPDTTEPIPNLALHAWPDQVQAIKYPASIDNSKQPMLLRAAQSTDKRPLLVGLHTWSSDYLQAGGQVVYARWCVEKDWHFIHPNFRGQNWTPEGCGSEMAVQDIIDAVAYMKTHYNVDTDRIYLVGVSGGGHAATLLAGRAPEIWAGVSAWASISDIQAWWEQSKEGPYSRYAKHIEQAVGGHPDQDEKAALECAQRSPITYLQNATRVNLDINAGITDGREGGSVPFSHSLYAFNQVVSEADKLSPKFIENFYENQTLPDEFHQSESDTLYGQKPVLFRKVSGNTRITIFQGEHEIIHHAALNWLAQQRKGKPATWSVTDIHTLDTDDNESKSGK